MKPFGFPKEMRLRKAADFERVFTYRCSVANDLLVVYVAKSSDRNTRLGLVVSRKCGNAVQRNRWKRLLREAFRLVHEQLPNELDLVVIPRASSPVKLKVLQDSLLSLAQRGAVKLSRRSCASKGIQ